MTRREKSIKSLVLALCCSSAVLSCSNDFQARGHPQWAVSFRWSAEQNVNLDSVDAQIVRAAIESNTIAEFLNPEYGYPGWRDNREAMGLEARIEHAEYEGVGTAYLHIVPYQSPVSRVMIVCKDMTETSKKIGNDYVLPNFNNRKEALEVIAVDVVGESRRDSSRVEPVKLPNSPDIPGPEGRSPRPSKNVFSRHALVRYQGDLDNYRDLCLPWAQARWGGDQPPAPGRTAHEPPTIEPFMPGWPE
ncbi:hypothetical protein [Nocardia wallacei]|uniref:hypothetical protein n=1 Tax=Nocardia wallacei TaxID=480035 RepID=UPI002458E2C2|nr:hypothetical protein [Nocardia wallacei]